VRDITEPIDDRGVRPRLDVSSVYADHAEFVWKSLFRLGVRDDDLEDMVQEVFMVVHRRLDSFDGSARMTTWLFGIAMRVASSYHRRAHRRRERATDFDDESLMTPPETPAEATPEHLAAEQQARGALDRILGEMDMEKRATFVLFEIEGLPCQEIAALTSVPVGTVYSRLHGARAIFEREVARLHAGVARGAR
jgi:RNA polymerase sigma-70 factor (ECF subfamily)